MKNIGKDDKIVVRNFWRNIEPHDIYESNLWWDKWGPLDAQTDDPELIFRYYIETVGFNLTFYYVDDGCFYEIFTERLPVNVYRMLPNPDWDGRYIIDSAIGAGESHVEGELIYSTPDASTLWSELKIRGKSIGEVLERSVILTLD